VLRVFLDLDIDTMANADPDDEPGARPRLTPAGTDATWHRGPGQERHICSSTPAAPDPVSIEVLSVQASNGLSHGAIPAPGGPPPSEVQQIAAHTVTVINPAAIPTGTELFFSYSGTDQAVFADLIDTSSYTCTNSQ